MLQEKLEQESRAAQRRRMQIVIGIAASVAVIGLAYGGIVLLRPSTDVTNAPEASQTAPEAVSRTPSVVPEVVSSAPVVAPDEAASEAARDQFKLCISYTSDDADE